jgi:NhaP-type Na+/H+ and K+/H+ antiporter
MREHMPHIDTRVAAIFRHDSPIRPQGSTIVEAGDEVFFIAASQHIRAVMSEFSVLKNPISASCWLAAAISALVWQCAGKRLQR